MASLAARSRSFAILLVSCAIFISMMAVLSLRKAGVLETPIRTTAAISELIVVPVLLVFASRDWLTNQRKDLAAWRNGLGCSSIVVLATIWVLYDAAVLLLWSAPRATSFIDGIEWIGLFLSAGILAFVLAFALRGPTRIYAMSSALLLFAGIQSSIYV